MTLLSPNGATVNSRGREPLEQHQHLRVCVTPWSSGCASLGADEVRVWVVPLTPAPVSAEELLPCLTNDERARAERYRVAKAQHQFVTGRGLLRQILGTCLGVSPHEVPIAYTGAGKPVLADSSALHFNVTHTDGLALIALATRPIGVDAERLRSVDDPEGLVGRFFSSAEQATYLALSAESRLAGFFRGWTSKESLIKAAGLSVAYLDEFDVELNPDQPAALLAARHPDLVGKVWRLAAFTPAPGYVAAVAVEGQQDLVVEVG